MRWRFRDRIHCSLLTTGLSWPQGVIQSKWCRNCNSSNISIANNLGVRYNKTFSNLNIEDSRSSIHRLPDIPEKLIGSVELPSKASKSKPCKMMTTTIIILAVLLAVITISLGTALGFSHNKVNDLMKLLSENASTTGKCFKHCSSFNKKAIYPFISLAIPKALIVLIMRPESRERFISTSLFFTYQNLVTKHRAQNSCDVSIVMKPQINQLHV